MKLNSKHCVVPRRGHLQEWRLLVDQLLFRYHFSDQDSKKEKYTVGASARSFLQVPPVVKLDI